MAIIGGHRRPLRLLLLVGALLFVSFFTFSGDFYLGDYLPTPQYFAYVKTSYDWANRTQKHPVDSYTPLPAGKPLRLAKVQYDFPRHVGAQPSRRNEVQKTFRKTWNAYRRYAWGYDELSPVSLSGTDTFAGWGATLVDALDSLLIMDMKAEFVQAMHFVVAIDWDRKGPNDICNLFETNIRYLGGLLSAYDLSNETLVLRKAVELGDMLYNAFDTPNRMPSNQFHFQRARDGNLVASNREISANIGSLSLEFTRLSQLTGDPKFFDAIERIKRHMVRSQNETKLPGMWPMFVDVAGDFQTPDTSFTLGSMADSLYEYLPKMYALLGGLDVSYRDMYTRAMDTAKAHLLFRPMLPDGGPDGTLDVLFSGNVRSNGAGTVDLHPQAQHLTCFVGGMFGLGGRLFDDAGDVAVGERLARGCAWAYRVMPAHVMPEEFTLIPCRGGSDLARCEWRDDRWQREGSKKLPMGFSSVHNAMYLLRPEAIESVFYMWRITGDEAWRDTAWDMFQAIKRATQTRYAFSAIMDVTKGTETEKMDSMESFWMAETLKYFYLIFSEPDLISLDDYVFNTEAHPFRIPKP